MLVVRVGEDTLREVVPVDRRRNAADAELPGDEHHVLGRLPEVPHDRQWRIDGLRVRRDEGDRRGRAGQVPGVWPHIGKLAQRRAVLDRDERPALGVLGAPGTPARVEDPFEVLRV